jgi:hypothetical protein
MPKSVPAKMANTAKKSRAVRSKPTKKTPVNNTRAAEELYKPRRLRMPTYKSLRYHKRIKHPHTLPSAWKIFKATAVTVWSSKKLFLGIVLVYGLLNILLVRGFGNTNNIAQVKSQLDGSGNLAHVFGGIALFAGLAASSGNNATSTSGVFQLLLVLIITLVVIWSFRQVAAGTIVTVKNAFYKGTYPLVQFILVLFVVTLQLIPAVLGTGIYSLVITTGVASFGAEMFVWGLLCALLILLTLYMITSSLFALYIVTLPDMTPMRALRSARELVRYRRWTIMRKLLYLPLALFIVAALIMVPIILTVTALASWVFFLLSMAGIVIINGYMYTLYRELLI